MPNSCRLCAWQSWCSANACSIAAGCPITSTERLTASLVSFSANPALDAILRAGDNEVAGPSQHQAAGDALAVHFGDRRLGQVAPAPGDLQIDFLLAGKAAMGVGFGEAAPISDRRKIDASRILVARAQIVPGRE